MVKAHADVFEEAGEKASDRAASRMAAEQLLGVLAARKRAYGNRKPSIISIVSLPSLQRLLSHGVAGAVPVSDRLRRRCQQVAAGEVEHIAALVEAEPMGLQFGLLPLAEPSSAFTILRARDRATLAVNPFHTDDQPGAHSGVAMITVADEAVSAHQRVAEALWRESAKGSAAAGQIRGLGATAKAA